MKILTKLAGACLIAATLLFTLPAKAVVLAWDANTEVDIAGYFVHVGVSPGVYTNVIYAGNVTTNTVSGLVDGVTYYFAVTALNTGGLESDLSNEISFTPLSPLLATLTATNLTRTNLLFRGSIVGVPTQFTAWFDYCFGPTWNTNALLSTPLFFVGPGNTNYTLTATVTAVRTNGFYRVSMTNNSVFSLSSAPVPFSTIPPASPQSIRVIGL